MGKEVKSAILAGILLSFLTFSLGLLADLYIKNGEIKILPLNNEEKQKLIFIVENWSRKFENEFEIRISSSKNISVIDKNNIYRIDVKNDGYDGFILSFKSTDSSSSGVLIVESSGEITERNIKIISAPFGYDLNFGGGFSYYNVIIDNILRVLFTGLVFSIITYYIERKLSASIEKTEELSNRLEVISGKNDAEKKKYENRINILKLLLVKRLKEADVEISMWRRVISRVLATTFNDRSHGKEIVRSFVTISGGSVNWGKEVENIEYEEIFDLLDQMRRDRSNKA
ncbi:hypothetical protein [Ancylobacter amanitiformis]|uniref:DUF4129 domain-containing protein n=1 Tax=Ancylobacter amanitiformis TaxID=217069 RepID=A0ABU0LT98_9HYPH|nr:hypothetical protein [Ancylobacter amanitiformis]MDQ0511923.1 hypothetical protein [Ancylobacter amanitiformis]